MITQTFKQGKNEIRIESPESVDDIKKSGFKEGQNCRIFINGKETDNYMAMIQFIVAETVKNESSFIPGDPIKLQKEIMDTQTKLTNNAAAAGLGNPKKYFFSSRSSLTLKRASLNAAQQQ
jgi:hypothetical protein